MFLNYIPIEKIQDGFMKIILLFSGTNVTRFGYSIKGSKD